MKTLALTLVLVLVLASVSFAADVNLTITIPDAYVARTRAAFEADNEFTGQGIKAFAEAKVQRWIRRYVRRYELRKAEEALVVTDIELQ